MARVINTHFDDSDAEILNFLSDKIQYYWRKVDKIREKNDPTDGLMLNFYMNKLVRLQNVMDHLKYN